MAFDCRILGWTELPALGSNTFAIEAVRTSDKLGIIQKALDLNTTCQKFVSWVYSLDNPPYTTYRMALSSSGTSYGNICDIGPTGEVNQSCISQVIVRYNSFMVSTVESAPGITKVDILINQQAIVGAVAFFGWFLIIFQDIEVSKLLAPNDTLQEQNYSMPWLSSQPPATLMKTT
jgi:hypothetical protein